MISATFSHICVGLIENHIEKITFLALKILLDLEAQECFKKLISKGRPKPLINIFNLRIL